MKRRAEEEISIGSFVQLTKKGTYIKPATYKRKMPIGMAARNIKKNETIEYCSYENTKDILVKSSLQNPEVLTILQRLIQVKEYIRKYFGGR